MIMMVASRDHNFRQGHIEESDKAWIFLFDVTATYMELLLGITQAFSMYELYLTIRSTTLFTDYERCTWLARSTNADMGSMIQMK